MHLVVKLKFKIIQVLLNIYHQITKAIVFPIIVWHKVNKVILAKVIKNFIIFYNFKYLINFNFITDC